jgi:hypothetical protein
MSLDKKPSQSDMGESAEVRAYDLAYVCMIESPDQSAVQRPWRAICNSDDYRG